MKKKCKENCFITDNFMSEVKNLRRILTINRKYRTLYDDYSINKSISEKEGDLQREDYLHE